MPLFTDGLISSIDDLSGQDSQLLDVASNEGINLSSKLALAQESLGTEITVMLGRLQFWSQHGFWPSLANVAVTSPLRLWHTYWTLAMTYSDAYSNQLNDRYRAKRDQFQEMARWASEKLVQTGIGIVTCPVTKAATPQLLTIPGTLPDGIYYVTMSWVNAFGEEGASAVPAVVTLTTSTIQAGPGPKPQNANGWNVFVGDSPDTMFQQNGSPIDPAQFWDQPSSLIRSGRTPGTGQEPTYALAVPRVIPRG